ncbi:TPA: hypothetical protein ACH3X2_013296 [Trebouxia sp. C0005]
MCDSTVRAGCCVFYSCFDEQLFLCPATASLTVGICSSDLSALLLQVQPPQPPSPPAMLILGISHNDHLCAFRIFFARSLHAAQASLSQSIAALTGTFSLLLVTTSSCASRNVCQQFSTCHQSFAKKELQNYLHTCCKEACINAYRLCSCGMACKDCCH